MMTDYSKMTNDDFDRILADKVKKDCSVILSIPGVYEILAEHYNNDVLDTWENEQSTKEIKPSKQIDPYDDHLALA